jgi:hypothetical protein
MIFILGGNGFIGSGLVRYCEANNLSHQVITRENYKNFIGQHCEVFINANGNSKMYLARQNPLEDFDASVRSVRASLTDSHSRRKPPGSIQCIYPNTQRNNATTDNTPSCIRFCEIYDCNLSKHFISRHPARHPKCSFIS